MSLCSYGNCETEALAGLPALLTQKEIQTLNMTLNVLRQILTGTPLAPAGPSVPGFPCKERPNDVDVVELLLFSLISVGLMKNVYLYSQ